MFCHIFIRCLELPNRLDTQFNHSVDNIVITRAFFLGGRRGTHTPKHFVNLTGESKDFKIF
jgi:hypothetical protein